MSDEALGMDDGDDEQGGNPHEEIKEILAGGVVEEIAAKVEGALWRKLLVWKDGLGKAGAEVDWDASVKQLIVNDVKCAQSIVEKQERQSEVLGLSDAKILAYMQWDGRLWHYDAQPVAMYRWMTAHWAAMEKAIEHLERLLKDAGDAKYAEIIDNGGDEAAANKARDGVLKRGRQELVKARSYLDKFGGNATRNSVLKEIIHVDGMDAKDADFDADPGLTVFANGSINFGALLRAAETARGSGGSVAPEFIRKRVRDALAAFGPHNPTHKATIATDAVYDPSATCPMFLKYLEDTLPNEQTRAYLQRALGSSLLGDPTSKIMLNLIGPRNTGKSLLLNIMNNVMGDYCHSVNPELFLKGTKAKDANAPSPALNDVRKAKLVTASEPDSQDQWDGGFLKTLTGHEQVTARGLFRDNVTFYPRFLIVIASNFFVRLDTNDEALVQRIAPVEFSQMRRAPGPGERLEDVPEAERVDDRLQDRICGSEEERSGIWNWLIDGLVEFLVIGGLGEAPGVAEHRETMKKALSTSKEFVEDLLEHGILVRRDAESVIPQSRIVGVQELHKAYTAWCEENDAGHPRGRKRFSEDVALDYTSKKASVRRGNELGGMGFDGLAWADWETWYEEKKDGVFETPYHLWRHS